MHKYMVFKCSMRGKKFKTISLELETQLSQQFSWYIVVDANKSDVYIILVSCESNIGSITYQVNRYDKLCVHKALLNMKIWSLVSYRKRPDTILKAVT